MKEQNLQQRELLSTPLSLDDQEPFKADLEKQLRIAVSDLGLIKKPVPQKSFHFLLKNSSAEYKSKKQYILNKIKTGGFSRWSKQ